MCIDNYDRQGVASRAIAEAKARQAARAQADNMSKGVQPAASSEGNTSDLDGQGEDDRGGEG